MTKMHNPPHPGNVLREYLPEAMTMTEVAARLGVTRQALSAVVNGRAGISPEMAVRL
jgi:antitoxin HigA-1